MLKEVCRTRRRIAGLLRSLRILIFGKAIIKYPVYNLRFTDFFLFYCVQQSFNGMFGCLDVNLDANIF